MFQISVTFFSLILWGGLLQISITTSYFACPIPREMASEKEASEASDAYYTTAPPERLEDDKTRPESSLSKALAHRALYGSNGSRLGRSSRKGRNKDIKVPASRLSKVSLADQTETAQ